MQTMVTKINFDKMTTNIPIFRIVPSEDTEMTCISLVEYPAMETDFLKFNEDKMEAMAFTAVDEMKHIVTGVAIRADVPIYRRNGDQEYFVVFEKDTIPAIVEKYFRRNLSNLVNVQHDGSTLSNSDAVMIESYFIDKSRGIVPEAFKDIEDGSWCISYKITNEELWNQIMTGTVKGFSIELMAELAPIKVNSEDEELIDAITK